MTRNMIAALTSNERREAPANLPAWSLVETKKCSFLDDLRGGRLVAISRVAVRSRERYSLRVAERTARTNAFACWLGEEAAAFAADRDRWLFANGFRLTPERPQA